MGQHTDERPSLAPDGRPQAECQAWRRDFPIDWPQDFYVARRDFTKFLGLTSLAWAVGQLWIGLQSWRHGRRDAAALPRRRIAALDEVPVGGAVVFRYPGANDPCLLVRPDRDTLRAFSQKCTHLSCAVVPRVGEHRLHCPCHNGYFDLESGQPVAGPPRRPLPGVRLEIAGGVVFAHGFEADGAGREAHS